jgi:O-antigen/teichoic acid export membrane protein
MIRFIAINICLVKKNALIMTCLEMIIRYGMVIITLPIALKNFDDTELAYYLLINTLLALAYLADSGFSQTIVRVTAYFLAGAVTIPKRVTEFSYLQAPIKPNSQAVGRLIATSHRIYLIIGLIATILLGTVGVRVALNIISQQNNQTNAWLSYFCLVVLSIFLLQTSRWSSLLQGLNEIAQAKRIEITVGLIRLLGVVIAMMANFGILGVIIALTLSASLNIFLTRRIVRKIILKYGVNREYEIYDPDMLKSLWPATWRMGIICLGAFLIYYGSSIVVSQLHDPKIIASYMLTFQVVMLSYRFATSPSLVYQPEIAAAMSMGDLFKINYLTLKIVRYSISLYLLGAIFIYFFAENFLIMIGTKSAIINEEILLLILILYFLEMHHSIHAGIYMSSNHIPFMMPSLYSGAAIVITGYYSVHLWGVYGVVLSQLFVQAIFNNWYPVYLSLKIQKMTYASYLRGLFSGKLKYQ